MISTSFFNANKTPVTALIINSNAKVNPIQRWKTRKSRRLLMSVLSFKILNNKFSVEFKISVPKYIGTLIFFYSFYAIKFSLSAGNTFPTASPKPIRTPSFSHHPSMTTVSPSAKNLRSVPSAI